MCEFPPSIQAASPRFSRSSQVSTESRYGMKSVFFFFLFCLEEVMCSSQRQGLQNPLIRDCLRLAGLVFKVPPESIMTPY